MPPYRLGVKSLMYSIIQQKDEDCTPIRLFSTSRRTFQVSKPFLSTYSGNFKISINRTSTSQNEELQTSYAQNLKMLELKHEKNK